MSENHIDDAEPVTDHVHDNSWSANLEAPQYTDGQQLLVEHALDAIECTTAGNHVNRVTHANHGHPETYLHETLADCEHDVDWEYIDQCGCGGHVTRVHVN